MRTFAFSLLLAATAFPAVAAERGYSVTDFDRIRIDGPYKVTLATGRSPGARAFGAQGAIDAVTVEVQGRTLIVKRNSQTWGGYPGKPAGPVELRITGYAPRAATLNGAGSLVIDKMKGASLDLLVAGSGLLTVGAIEADRLTVGVIGNGRAEVAGKAAIAQLAIRGTGVIDGGKLITKDAKVIADGPGSITVSATVTAGVVSNGAGEIVVLGNPACTVKANGSGTVACGK